MNTKQFGRWGEGCVARYLRDRGLTVLTADHWNMTPYIDLTATQRIGTPEQITYHVQVKATTKASEAGFPFHYAELARCVGYAEGALKPGQEFLFAVVCLPRRLGYFYGAAHLASVCREADCANGSHFSVPGMLRLEQAYSLARFPLTATELAEGEAISGRESPDQPQRQLFG